MAEITRSSRLAVVEETTEGVGVSPASGNDYVVLQEGFELTGEFENLESAELKGSIGKSKSILGFETSNFSCSHYLNHSSVEGQAPEYNLFFKSLLGTETIQGGERTTTAGSTAGTSAVRAVVELAAGGSDYALGKAMLIKDGTNGYNIRNVYSVASDSVTLAQNLLVAPATGVDCGIYVNYSPSDSGHPSLSMWLYRANGGDVELSRGTKIEEGTIEVTAGEFVNASFTGTGIGYDFDPIEITASSSYIDFTTDAGTLAAQLTLGIYKDPIALAAEIQTKMQAQTSTEVLACVWNSGGANAGKFTISASSTSVFSILWSSGTNTANSAKTVLGFDNTDDTGALTYDSDSEISWASPQSPTFDNSDPIAAKNIEVMVGDFDDINCFEAQSLTITIANTKQNIPDVCSESGISGSLHSARDVTGSITATLSKHDADKFFRFRSNAETMVTVNIGTKDASGNWEPGKCCNIWVSRSTVNTHTVGDTDGIVTINLDFSGYVENAEGEVFINFL